MSCNERVMKNMRNTMFPRLPERLTGLEALGKTSGGDGDSEKKGG